jgi:hypothetical protein
MSECYGDVVLHFDYPYNGSRITFLDRTDRVNVGIYNEEEELVKNIQIERESLIVNQGVTLHDLRAECTYTAVCWGNAFDQTHINWDARQVHHPDLHDDATAVETNDPLTYGRLTFTVHQGINADTVHFEPAVINFEISAMGLQNNNLLRSNSQPYIRMSGLETEVYDFNMTDTDPEQRTFYPTWDAPTTAGVLTLRTAVHRMDNDNNVVIDLMNDNVNNRVLNRIALKDYIAQYPQYTIKNQKELTIYITYKLNTDPTEPMAPNPIDPTDPNFDGSITIYPKAWQLVEVTPIVE